jgi:hypothetical protein
MMMMVRMRMRRRRMSAYSQYPPPASRSSQPLWVPHAVQPSLAPCLFRLLFMPPSCLHRLHPVQPCADKASSASSGAADRKASSRSGNDNPLPPPSLAPPAAPLFRAREMMLVRL